ncbi:MAG: hypothetical protein ACPG7F_11590 [Aggregatilineales bacterium]
MTRLNTGDTAPDAELFTADGEITHLSSLWDTRPTLLSFLRHFG